MARTRSTSCSSIYARISQSPPLVAETNVYGSFTTTVPATLWLRTHLTLNIPFPASRDCYDSPPDSPLSFLSRRSPSITRTLTDVDVHGPAPSSPSSPSTDGDDDPPKLHPVLRAVERASKLSSRSTCSTCMRPGTNYPRCPRCDETWCSRECRLQGGKKHRCAVPKI